MDAIFFSLFLLLIVFFIGVSFSKYPIFISPILFLTGVFLSLIPGFKIIELNPNLVLEVFLPLLIYEACAIFPWQQILINLQPIIFLSLGHVLFITLLVGIITYYFIPQLASWPIAFMFGAIVSPPDHVAISAIAESNYLPRRLISILQGEGMLNDAAALVIFKFSLAAALTHEFLILHATFNFFAIIVGETFYGLFVGYVIGEIRLRLGENVKMHMIISFLTPFMAYLFPHSLGGSGIISTVVSGLYIGHKYLDRFPSTIRITGTSIWTTFGYIIPCVLFLMAGLEFKSIYIGINNIPIETIFLYITIVILTIIIGRFIWVFAGAYLFPLLISPFKKIKYPPWQYLFLVAWSGIRGVVSLAAALAIPYTLISAGNVRDLMIFLVFAVIFITFLFQGLALPYIIKWLKLNEDRRNERVEEQFSFLSAKETMSLNIIEFLLTCKREFEHTGNDKIKYEIERQIKKYNTLNEKYNIIKNELQPSNHQENFLIDDIEDADIVSIVKKIIDIEKQTLDRLFREGKINQAVKKKLLHQIDHKTQHSLE